MAGRTPSTQLLIVTDTAEGAAERLQAVIAACPVASIVIAEAGEGGIVPQKAIGLVGLGQSAGAAVLIGGDAHLARTLKADGVHLGFVEEPQEAFEAARAVVGGRGVVGADAGRFRHTAMSLGELGADYVAFGVPGFVKDRETAFERQLELIDWWAEIFEVPCVAMDVVSAEQARALAEAGADFVGLAIGGGLSVVDAVAQARAFADAIGLNA